MLNTAIHILIYAAGGFAVASLWDSLTQLWRMKG